MRARSWQVRGIVLAWLLVLSTAAAAQLSLPQMVPFMTNEELVVLNALRTAASDEGVELVVLPVGSWGARIEGRLAAATALKAAHPTWSNDDIMKRLVAENAELFPGAGSDFDLTVALKDVPGEQALAKEARVVQRATSFVEKELPERAALVKVMGEGAWHGEKFSGAAGRSFALWSSPYALHVSPGTTPIRRIPAAAFYTERGLPVPQGLGSRATQWVDDAMGILADTSAVAAGTNLAPEVAQARAAIKYWKKYKSFFEQELGAALPEDLRKTLLARLDDVPLDVKDLLALDNEALTARLELMRRYSVEAADGTQRSALDLFSERTLESMRRYRDQVEVIDLVRRGRLAPTVTAVGEALTRWDAVKRALLRTGGRVVGSAARHLLLLPALRGAMEKYATGDTVGFSREVAGMLADLAGVGEAAFAAELADLGRELAAAGLIAAADAALFDPLNQQVLAAYYNTATDPNGVFTMEGSPFEGLSRETLYARYRMSPDEARRALQRDALRFVEMLPRNEQLVGQRVTGFMDLVRRLGFLTSGPGSLTEALTAALLADWERSRVETEQVLAWAERLSLGGYFVPQLPPLELYVDGTPIPAGQPHAVTWTLAPGEKRTVELYLVRRYGKRFAIPGALRTFIADDTERRQTYRPLAGGATRQILEVFERGFEVGTPPRAPGLPPGPPIRLRGRAGVERWVQASTGLYETAPLALAHTTAGPCPGWTLEAPWTAGPGWDTAAALAYPYENGEGPIDTRTAKLVVGVTAPLVTTAPCRVDETLVVTWRAPAGGGEQTFTVNLSATTPTTTDERTPGFAVTGRVTNRATGAPLPGARAVLAGPVTLTASAGTDGYVALTPVPPGTYEVSITHPGFEPRRGTIEVTRDRLNGRFALTPIAEEEPAAPVGVREAPIEAERSSGLSKDEIARLDQLCACIVQDRADYNSWHFSSAGFKQAYPRATSQVSVAAPGRFNVDTNRCEGRAEWDVRYEPGDRVWHFEFDWAKSGGIPNPPASRPYPEGCCTWFINGRCWREAR